MDGSTMASIVAEYENQAIPWYSGGDTVLRDYYIGEMVKLHKTARQQRMTCWLD